MIEVCEAERTELPWEIKLIDWSMAGNLSNQSSGVQIPRDICTRLERYLYSVKCSWIMKYNTAFCFLLIEYMYLNHVSVAVFQVVSDCGIR